MYSVFSKFLAPSTLVSDRCWKNMNNLVLSFTPKFTKLLTLVLRQENPQLEDTAVETIAKFCHDLQDLDLSKSFKVGDRSLYALAHGYRNLTKLNISGCTSFSDEGVEYLTKFCRKLKILNLCGCVKAATDCALQAIGDLGVMSLAYGCPDLRCLDLCGCVRIIGIAFIGFIFGICSVNGRQTLHALKMKTALTPSAVQALCDTFPALHTCSGRHSLVMSGCLNLTSVHCACAVQSHRTLNNILHTAH
ncbi:hypothetical protein GOBAR_DD01763 [Gossypium barbadense]|nr:hypothetical protein GOBAR_DD01763 [Gossypium barbadense]